MNIKYYTSFALFFYLLYFQSSCTHQNESIDNKNPIIVAKVGDALITVDDFRRNYELGFANLKTGKNRKKTYLDYMIKEKLLSLEGYKLGLDKSDYVEKSEEALKRELLIELLLQKEVRDKIKVTEDEIKESMNKSKVKFKFRYWYESTLEKAKIIAEKMRKRGYANVLNEILMKNPEYKIDPKSFETDYLTYLAISPDLLSAIKDLPYGEISDPIELKGKFYIFQVLDIRRNAITENEYKSEASSVEQVLFYQKFEKALVEYGSDLLDRKSIKTKRKAFNLLADAILEWKQDNKNKRLNFIESLKNSNKNQTALFALSKNMDKPFFEYKDGYISISEFLNDFDTSKFLKDFINKNEFYKYLNTKIAQSIRDHFLIKEARSKNIQELPQFQKEILLWKDKWVYEELRRETITELSINKKEVTDYFNKFINRYNVNDKKNVMLSDIYIQVKNDAIKDKLDARLNTKITQLKNYFKIEINEAVLDTINVIDLQKSRWATMQIFKLDTNKPAYPVVDPRLSNFNR